MSRVNLPVKALKGACVVCLDVLYIINWLYQVLQRFLLDLFGLIDPNFGLSSLFLS